MPFPQNEESIETYYKIFGLRATATKSDIKKAYHEKVLLYHPDKGGTSSKFILLNKAYQSLLELTKDKHEISTLPQNIPKPKTKNITHKLEITLQEAFTGKKKQIKLNRNKLCPQCNGKGSDLPSNILQCSKCFGTGYLNSSTKCPGCLGEGNIFKSKCKVCNGAKVTLQTKTLEINIKPGIYSGYKLLFEGESEEYPGFDPGDVIFEIKVKDDKKYKRIGSDLYIETKISLLHSLTGGTITVPTLDGKKISAKYNEIISPGTVKCIKEKGMPFFNKPEQRGDLIITFIVEFPKVLDDRQKKIIKSAFDNSINNDNKPLRQNKKYFSLGNINTSTIKPKVKNFSIDKGSFYTLSEFKQEEAHKSYNYIEKK